MTCAQAMLLSLVSAASSRFWIQRCSYISDA